METGGTFKLQACVYVSIISVCLSQGTHAHTHIINSKGNVGLKSNLVILYCVGESNRISLKTCRILINSPVADNLIINSVFDHVLPFCYMKDCFSPYGFSKRKFANKTHLSFIQKICYFL